MEAGRFASDRIARDGAYRHRGQIYGNLGGTVSATLLTDDDLYLLNEGNHFQLHDKMGAHLGEVDGAAGTHFAVWAPNAERVSVVGDFNEWDGGKHPL